MKEATHKWEFKPRFRRHAFGWRSQPAITRIKQAVTEVKKVVWPTRKESLQTAGIVFAFVLVMAVFLWISDKTLEYLLYDLILGWKKL